MNTLAYLHDPLILRAFGAAMSVILIVGALGKLRDIEVFQYAVEDYRLLGSHSAAVFARVFPAAELLAGISLLLDWPHGLGMVLGLVVMAVATGGLVISLLRGLTTIECGCGTGGQRISWGLVMRNLCLSAAIVAGSGEGAVRQLSPIDYFSLTGAVLGLLALYACINQLLANQPLLKEIQS